MQKKLLKYVFLPEKDDFICVFQKKVVLLHDFNVLRRKGVSNYGK